MKESGLLFLVLCRIDLGEQEMRLNKKLKHWISLKAGDK
jgi:hypothetical protein